MFDIKTYNKISDEGLNDVKDNGCNVGTDVKDQEGIVLRRADLHNTPFGDNLLAIARAGAGYNNIPINECAEKGIVVFNTPGVNAEGVKELELCSLVMSSRDVLGSIAWVRSVADKGSEIPVLVEKAKSDFAGPELMGKTIGVLGLGATGAMVANIALEIGMKVLGYDPFMSVEAAWMLSREVIHVDDLDEVFAKSDYISINIPYNENTHHLLNAEAFSKMKQGIRIINESRAEVVDDIAMTKALDSGKVAKYVTDFPNETILKAPNVIAMPHLGACTPESEDRCAVMAANELYDYLENGNIKNSVNYPNCDLGKSETGNRISVFHENKANMITQLTSIIGSSDVNIASMASKSKKDVEYTLFDLDNAPAPELLDQIRRIPGVYRVREICRT